MKNEREKEIEHVKHFTGTAEDFLNKEIRQDSKSQYNNKTQTFQSPGPNEKLKSKGRSTWGICRISIHHKKKEAKEKKWNWKN